MKPKKLLKLLSTAKEKDFEESVWEYWLTLGIKVQQEQPFDQYLSELKKTNPNTYAQRTEKEIMEDAERILNSMKRT